MLFAKWFLNIKERSKDSRESLHQNKGGTYMSKGIKDTIEAKGFAI